MSPPSEVETQVMWCCRRRRLGKVLEKVERGASQPAAFGGPGSLSWEEGSRGWEEEFVRAIGAGGGIWRDGGWGVRGPEE